MRDEGGLLNTWKERGLFAVTAAALATYVLWLSLAAPPGGVDAGTSGREDQDEKNQRYVRASGGPALPADAREVFARPGRDAYFGEALRRVWVEPKAEEERVVLRLEAPPPVVPAPPMLLPVPGPALHATSGLPRWPTTPVPAVKDKEEEEAEGEGEAREAGEKPRDVKPRDVRPRGEGARDERLRDRKTRDEKTRDRKTRDDRDRGKRRRESGRGRRRRPDREEDR